MLHRLPRWLSAAALSLALLAPAHAGQEVTLTNERGVAIGTPANPIAVTGGAGGGTASTVNQGTPGTVPWLQTIWQGGAALSATNPIFAQITPGTAAIGTVGVTSLPALPAGANAIGSVSVSNFPASQPVTNVGTFAVQNTAAVVGGNTAAVKVDGSTVTQPVSAAALPLPTGAATAAAQTSVESAPGTAAGTAVTVQGNASGVPVQVTVTNPNAAATTVTANQGTAGAAPWPVSAASLPLPAGAATAANQNATAAGTSAASAQGIQGVTGGVPIPVTDSLLASGAAKLQNAVWWIEANGVSAAASATVSSAVARAPGSSAGSPSSFGSFKVQIYTTQAGTLSVYNGSYTAGSALVGTAAVSATTPTTLSVPAFGASFSAVFTNGATAGVVNMADGFTAN